MAAEVEFAVVTDVMDRDNSNLQYHGKIGVVLGIDWGQGAIRGMAKILLSNPKTCKQLDNLSYGCPIVKVCHVDCRTNSYRLLKQTVATTLNSSIKKLQVSKLLIVHNRTQTVAAAYLIPIDAKDIQIMSNTNYCYSLTPEDTQTSITTTEELDVRFSTTKLEDMLLNTTITWL